MGCSILKYNIKERSLYLIVKYYTFLPVSS